MADYIEEFLQAIDLISTAKVNRANFDKTIVCNIIKNDEAVDGKYIVSDGASKFDAYNSDPNIKFEVGQTVNVLVPQNDYNQRKTILGKVVTKTSESFNYVSPLEKYFDMTGNTLPHRLVLDNNNEYKIYSLLANDDRTNGAVITLLKDYDLSGLNLKGYTRMALTSQFRSYIPTAVSGNYGLVLRLCTNMPKDAIDSDADSNYHEYIFDSNDMWGNPYNFANWFTQSIVFDLEDLEPNEQIMSMSMFFYQGKNFLVDNNEILEYYLKGHTEKIENNQEMLVVEEYMPDNLFIQDLNLSFGYTTSNEESLYLFTNNTLSYSAEASPNLNKKDLRLRWNHLLERNEAVAIVDQEAIDKYIKTIKDEDGNDAIEVDIGWYRYDSEYKEDDGYGKYWRRMSAEDNENSLLDADGNKVWEDKFNFSFIPNKDKNYEYIKTKITITDRVGVNSVTENYEKTIADYDNQILMEQNELKVDNDQLKLQLTLKKDHNNTNAYDEIIAKLEDSIKAHETAIQDLQRLKNSTKLSVSQYITVLTSNMLEFNNEIKVIEPDDYNKIRGLTIACDNDGAFRLYDSLTNDLVTPSLQHHDYHLTAKFIAMDQDTANNLGINKIEWAIPKVSTMIQPPLAGSNYVFQKDVEEFSEDDNYYYITRYTPTLRINKKEDEEGNEIEEVECTMGQTFRIKPHLLQSYGINTINCTITRNSYEYHAELPLSFGNTGTNGTNNTLILSFDQGEEAWTYQTTDSLKLKVEIFNSDDEKLYDSSLPDQPAVNISWKIINDPDNCFYVSNNTLLPNPAVGKNGVTNGCILQCEVSYRIDTSYDWVSKYTGYLIVPWRKARRYNGFVGADRVIYGTGGTVDSYSKEIYSIKDSNRKVDLKSIGVYYKYNTNKYGPVRKKNSGEGISDFMPYVSTNSSDQSSGRLIPRNLFFNDIDYLIWIEMADDTGVLWKQPLLIIQNNWGASLINDWDGRLSIDEENGTILGTMLGAGKKDNNNKFEGVLMGDVVAGAGDSQSGTGLFGYKDGIQSFGFLTGGTAFIGKSGRTQLHFDGEKGTIKNSGYDSNPKDGMKLDFDGNNGRGAFLDMQKGNAQVKISADSPYLTIKNVLGEKVFSVTDDQATIGGWKVTDTLLTGGGTTLNSNGTITCANLYANNNGQIGGWTIGSSTLTGGNTTLDSNGTITCSNLIATNTGQIGNFTIESDKLSGGTISGGYIYGGSINIGNGKFTVNRGTNYYTTTTGLNVGSGGLQVSDAGINANGIISTDSHVNSKYGYRVDGVPGRDETIIFDYYYDADVNGRTITLYKARMNIYVKGGIITGAEPTNLRTTSLTIGLINSD